MARSQPPRYTTRSSPYRLRNLNNVARTYQIRKAGDFRPRRQRRTLLNLPGELLDRIFEYVAGPNNVPLRHTAAVANFGPAVPAFDFGPDNLTIAASSLRPLLVNSAIANIYGRYVFQNAWFHLNHETWNYQNLLSIVEHDEYIRDYVEVRGRQHLVRRLHFDGFGDAFYPCFTVVPPRRQAIMAMNMHPFRQVEQVWITINLWRPWNRNTLNLIMWYLNNAIEDMAYHTQRQFRCLTFYFESLDDWRWIGSELRRFDSLAAPGQDNSDHLGRTIPDFKRGYQCAFPDSEDASERKRQLLQNGRIRWRMEPKVVPATDADRELATEIPEGERVLDLAARGWKGFDVHLTRTLRGEPWTEASPRWEDQEPLLNGFERSWIETGDFGTAARIAEADIDAEANAYVLGEGALPGIPPSYGRLDEKGRYP